MDKGQGRLHRPRLLQEGILEKLVTKMGFIQLSFNGNVAHIQFDNCETKGKNG